VWDSKAAAMFLFCEAKAKTASRVSQSSGLAQDSLRIFVSEAKQKAQ